MDIVQDDEYAWVVHQLDNTLTRIHQENFSILSASVGATPSGAAVDDSYVWVANFDDDTVSRIDKTNLNTIILPVGDGPSSIAVDDDNIWVTNQLDGTVTRIQRSDLSSEADIPAGSNPADIETGWEYDLVF